MRVLLVAGDLGVDQLELHLVHEGPVVGVGEHGLVVHRVVVHELYVAHAGRPVDVLQPPLHTETLSSSGSSLRLSCAHSQDVVGGGCGGGGRLRGRGGLHPLLEGNIRFEVRLPLLPALLLLLSGLPLAPGFSDGSLRHHGLPEELGSVVNPGIDKSISR